MVGRPRLGVDFFTVLKTLLTEQNTLEYLKAFRMKIQRLARRNWRQKTRKTDTRAGYLASTRSRVFWPCLTSTVQKLQITLPI